MKLYLAFLILLISFSFTFADPSPTPEPFDIDKVDFSEITQEDIDKTIEHRKQLDKQGATINEKQAVVIDAQAAALASATQHATELQGEIQKLAVHDRQMTDKVADQLAKLAKKDLAILRAWVIISVMGLLIGAYAVAKFYFHLPI